MQNESISRDILSNIIVHMKYAKYLPDQHRREVWSEIIERNMMMHIFRFPTLSDEIKEAYQYVFDKKVLPSMRSLQFSGKPVEINNTRLYNCSYLPMNHAEAFNEIMFLLLGGTGVGYSVQKHHVDKLPEVRKPKKTRRFLIGDSIEGWSDAVKVLIKAYMGDRASLPDFDYKDIRPKGTPLKTAGGLAPGPEPLKTCLHNIQTILDRKTDGEKLRPIEVHDICCHIADAVLSGGIRRSAMIALFSFDDDEMLAAKFGEWYELNPQRGRANNSAVILRHKIKKSEFFDLWKKIQASGSGEPGIFFTNDKEWGINPCAEIALRSFQFCNLCEINANKIGSQDELNRYAKAAAFIGTLQASYTNFHYLREDWKTTTEKEALIGVSLTGVASGDVFKFDLEEAARVVVSENKRVAKLIGINPSARCTCVKPSGTASLVLGSSSGVHAWHSKYYIRTVRILKNEPLYVYLSLHHPELLEDDLMVKNQAVISIPVKAPEGAVTREESALDLLDRVKILHEKWIKPAHNKGNNTHNVSCTVTVKDDEWDQVGNWMWDNREHYAALSILPYKDHSYVQAPFTEITKEEYDIRLGKLKAVKIEDVVEMHDKTNLKSELACSGGACEVV